MVFGKKETNKPKSDAAKYFPKKVEFDAKKSEAGVEKYLEGTQIEEGEDETGGMYYKQGRQVKDIVIEHIKKLGDLSLKELKEGYWKIKPVKIGDGVVITETYFEDLREAFCNGVDFLYRLIEPTLEEEKKLVLKGFYKKQEETLDKLFKEYKKGKGDPNDWVDEKLIHKQTLFSQINIHLDKIDYFKGDNDEFFEDV